MLLLPTALGQARPSHHSCGIVLEESKEPGFFVFDHTQCGAQDFLQGLAQVALRSVSPVQGRVQGCVQALCKALAPAPRDESQSGLSLKKILRVVGVCRPRSLGHGSADLWVLERALGSELLLSCCLSGSPEDTRSPSHSVVPGLIFQLQFLRIPNKSS